MALPLEKLLQQANNLGFNSTDSGDIDDRSSLPPLGQIVKLRELHKTVEQLSIEMEQRKKHLIDPSPSMAAQMGTSPSRATPNAALTVLLEQMNVYLVTLMDHLQKVILHKDAITSYLQQPFAGESIPVECEDQRSFCLLVAKASSQLSQLPQILNTLRWAATFNMDDGQLVRC